MFVLEYENNFGYAADAVILLPTRDKYEAIRAAGSDGINYGIENAGVIRWLRRLDRTHPFVVFGAGIDFVEARFEHAPRGRDARLLAQRMYRFDPDIVDQGTDTVAALAKELEGGYLYLWWD